MSTDVVYKYIPERKYGSPAISGVPARDIRESDIETDPDIAAIVDTHIANGGIFYIKAEPTKASKVKGAAKDATNVAEEGNQ